MSVLCVRHDVTHTLQRCAKLSVEDKRKPLWLRADERFFWNMVRHTHMPRRKGGGGGAWLSKKGGGVANGVRLRGENTCQTHMRGRGGWNVVQQSHPSTRMYV